MNAHSASVAADWPVKRTEDDGRVLRGSEALWAHQTAALARSKDMASFAFEFDPGLGKTATVIAEAGRMFLDGEIDTLIVVAPNRVHQQWIHAFTEWADFPWRGVAYPKGGFASQKRREALKQAMRISELKPALRVFTINFENVRQPKGDRGRPAPVPKALRLVHHLIKTSQRGAYVCIDEAHRIKDHKSQQARGALGLGRGVAKVRRRLTGTPILQGVQDLWSQYAFQDVRIIGSPNFYAFRSEYCQTAPVPGGRAGAVRIVGARNMDRLMRRIAPFTARVKKEDALDMPPKVFGKFLVEMEPEQARHYANMEELMMTGLREGEHAGTVVTAKIVLTQLQKLLQVSSGFIHDDDGRPIWISDVKVDAIREVVEDLAGEHVVVWAPFIPLLNRLEEALGPKVIRFRSLEDVARWKKQGGPLVANQMSGGVGVDGMQVANRALYAANSFHLEFRIQSIDRIHRGRQSRTCFYTDFLAAGTKDFAVLEALKAKEGIDAMTVDKLKKILLSGGI
jgi:SNF2 family DNA or RNA helicase